MDAAVDIGRNDVSKHQFSLRVENEQADTRRDGQPCFAKPFLRRERGQGNFSLFS